MTKADLSSPPLVCPVFYASHDGHTAQVAARIVAELAHHGVAAAAWDLAARAVAASDLPPFPFPIFLIAPIRYGFHLPAADAFLRAHKTRVDRGPLFLVSMNLTARKTGKKTRTSNVYLRKWCRKHGLDPYRAQALAGRLDYPRYGFFDRTMIRLIMTITGGPTDPSCVVDYTPWDEVAALAADLARAWKAGLSA